LIRPAKEKKNMRKKQTATSREDEEKKEHAKEAFGATTTV